MSYEIEWHIANTTPEENIANLLEKNKKILQIGGDPRLAVLLENLEYHRLENSQLENFKQFDEKFDYIILSDILELIDDPKSLITLVKNKTKETVIYEFKYDENCKIMPEWKQPWKSIGLEFFLSREFDYLSSIFLGYATVHICSSPYNLKEEDKDIPNAIR
jgi:hypothetical protein